MANKTDFKLKVGDCVLYDDTSGCAYAQFGIVEKVTDNEVILTEVYKRKRISLYPRQEDVFIYERRERYSAPTKCLGAYYKITKTEYNKIAKAFEKYYQCHTETCDVYRNIFFNAKQK